MFVCDKCHDSRCSTAFLEDFMRSRGACESCGVVTSCADCQGYKRLTARGPSGLLEVAE